jgi:hypothetical protein
MRASGKAMSGPAGGLSASFEFTAKHEADDQAEH